MPPTVSNTITVGSGPYSVAVSPDGTRAYVANNTANTVSVITGLYDSQFWQFL